jgi:hypothetical protein
MFLSAWLFASDSRGASWSYYKKGDTKFKFVSVKNLHKSWLKDLKDYRNLRYLILKELNHDWS